MIYIPREEIVILAAARTPQASMDGALSSFSAAKLGATAISAALERAGVDAEIVDECVMGNVISSGLMQAPAKQAAVGAGVPCDRPAKTINTVCASGMSAIYDACLSIQAGVSNVAIAGGMESRSRAPYLLGPFSASGRRLPGKLRGVDFRLRGPRKGASAEDYAEFFKNLGDAGIREASIHDSLACPFAPGLAMKDYAERYCQKQGIEVAEINAAAASSYRAAREARASGALATEIAPVEDVAYDDIIDEEREADLRAISYGFVTPYNAPELGDGASAVVLALRATAEKLGAVPLARISAISRVETPPEGFVHAPVDAVALLEEATAVRAEVVEANESFGMQIPVFEKEFGAEIINPFGGAVAITHPVGASGCRVVVTLLNALDRFEKKHGVATICYGSGGAMAIAVEKL